MISIVFAENDFHAIKIAYMQFPQNIVLICLDVSLLFMYNM